MEEYLTGLQSRLLCVVGDDKIADVMRIISTYSNDFDITRRCTELATFDAIPEELKTFLVTRKIEGMSPRSLELYKSILTELFERLRKPVEKVTTNDVRVFLYRIQEERGMTNRTLENKRSVIASFFEWCAEEEIIAKNPVHAIKPIKYAAKPRKALNGIELELIRNSCKTPREKAMVEFFYSTGCRASELVGCDITDVDFTRHEVRLLGKGNKYRISYINSKAEVALRLYLNSRSDGNTALFVTDRNPHDRLTLRSVERSIELIGVRAGLEYKLHPHLLRHTMATDGLSRGADITEIQQVLGHSNLNTTMIYAHVDKEKTRSDFLRLIV